MEQYEFALIPVLSDALKAVGLLPGVTAEAFVDGSRLIIQKAQDDALCEAYNEDCEGCPYCCPSCGECLKDQIQESTGEDEEDG